MSKSADEEGSQDHETTVRVMVSPAKFDARGGNERQAERQTDREYKEKTLLNPTTWSGEGKEPLLSLLLRLDYRKGAYINA